MERRSDVRSPFEIPVITDRNGACIIVAIKSSDLLSFHYYTYGEPFTGSLSGMRYRLSREAASDAGDEAAFEFEAAAWPEPYAEAFTDPELILRKRFAFTEFGKEEAVAWLNAVFPEFKA